MLSSNRTIVRYFGEMSFAFVEISYIMFVPAVHYTFPEVANIVLMFIYVCRFFVLPHNVTNKQFINTTQEVLSSLKQMNAKSLKIFEWLYLMSTLHNAEVCLKVLCITYTNVSGKPFTHTKGCSFCSLL